MSRSGIFRFVEDGIYRKNPDSVLVMEMQFIEIPEFPRLCGEKAIEAICDFVDEIEEQRGRALTEMQIKALIEFAWGLISSIEAEKKSGASEKGIKGMRFVSQPKKTIVKSIPESLRIHEDGRLWRLST